MHTVDLDSAHWADFFGIRFFHSLVRLSPPANAAVVPSLPALPANLDWFLIHLCNHNTTGKWRRTHNCNKPNEAHGCKKQDVINKNSAWVWWTRKGSVEEGFCCSGSQQSGLKRHLFEALCGNETKSCQPPDAITTKRLGPNFWVTAPCHSLSNGERERLGCPAVCGSIASTAVSATNDPSPSPSLLYPPLTVLWEPLERVNWILHRP